MKTTPIEKIDIERLTGNRLALDDEEFIPYNDIELLANTLNSIIDHINSSNTEVKCGSIISHDSENETFNICPNRAGHCPIHNVLPESGERYSKENMKYVAEALKPLKPRCTECGGDFLPHHKVHQVNDMLGFYHTGCTPQSDSTVEGWEKTHTMEAGEVREDILVVPVKLVKQILAYQKSSLKEKLLEKIGSRLLRDSEYHQVREVIKEVME